MAQCSEGVWSGSKGYTSTRERVTPLIAVATPGRTVGIDPGISGALVCVDEGELYAYIDMPTIQFGNSKAKFIDGAAVLGFIKRCAPDKIVIEMVASRPGQGISSSFQFGNVYGGVVAIAQATGVPVSLVGPSVWKRELNLLGTAKDAARLQALKRWPVDGALAFKRKKDGGRADAALVAHFGTTYTAPKVRIPQKSTRKRKPTVH